MRDTTSRKLCTEGQNCRPPSIVPVDGRHYAKNKSMQGLVDAFEGLAHEYSSDVLAETFHGTFNTIDVRKTETAAANFYMDTLVSWALKKQGECKTGGGGTCEMTIPRGTDISKLPIIAIVNSGTIRSNDYAEGQYPNARPFSMKEVRSDFPFPDKTAIWMMSAQDVLLSMLILATDHGDGFFPQIGGLEISLFGQRSNRLLAVEGDRLRPVLQVRLPKPHGPSFKAFSDCAIYDVEASCEHWGNWMQDDYMRDSTMLVIGPEFIMNEIDKRIKSLFSMVERLGDNLKKIGLDPVLMLKLWKGSRKDGHMVNLLKNEVILYNVFQEEIKNKYTKMKRGNKNLIPIEVGNDCINPHVAEVNEMVQGQLQFGWARAAQDISKVIKSKHQNICFRIKQVGTYKNTYVTDADQRKTDVFRERIEASAEEVQTKLSNAAKKYNKMRKKFIDNGLRKLNKKLKTHHPDQKANHDKIMKEVETFAGSDGWDKLKVMWKEIRATEQDPLLKSVNFLDLMLALGPYQWFQDDTPVMQSTSFNGLIAKTARDHWKDKFPGPRQLTKR